MTPTQPDQISSQGKYPVKLLKLMDGTDLLAFIVNDTKYSMQILYPIEIFVTPKPNGTYDLAFSKWIPFSKETSMELNSNLILCALSVENELLTPYLNITKQLENNIMESLKSPNDKIMENFNKPEEVLIDVVKEEDIKPKQTSSPSKTTDGSWLN